MNMAYYNVVFDQALDQVFDDLGIGAAYVRDGGGSCFTVEIHVTYIQELKLDDPIRVTFQLLDWDEKRLHFFGEMYHADEGYLAATSEQMSLHVDMTSRKAGPLPRARAAAHRRDDAAASRSRDAGSGRTRDADSRGTLETLRSAATRISSLPVRRIDCDGSSHRRTSARLPRIA